MTVRPQVWVGIDVGKTSHHVCAVDETGKVVWTQRGANQRVVEQFESPWFWRRLGLLDFDQGLVAPLGILERRFELCGWDVAEVAV